MNKTPYHQWTDDGKEVLILRYCAADGSSSRNWKYPLEVGAQITCPDWNPKPECGGGFRGWAWGIGFGDGAQPNFRATWLVIGADPKDVIQIDAKVKTRTGVIR